jgi:Na+-transporting NADH:ubiquinone oxidoreductase subunit NqrB
MSRTEKEIEFLTEITRLIVLVIVATTGGIVGLLFKLDNPISLPLVGIGAWIDITLLIGLSLVIARIQELLRRLE